MKQVVRTGFPRDVCTGVAHLQRKVGAVPLVAFSEVKIEIMYFLHEGWLYTGMLHQELVKEGSTTLLCSNNEKVGQCPHWSSSKSPMMPGSIGLLDASLHNLRFLSQVRTYYKPRKRTLQPRTMTRLTSRDSPTARTSLPAIVFFAHAWISAV